MGFGSEPDHEVQVLAWLTGVLSVICIVRVIT